MNIIRILTVLSSLFIATTASAQFMNYQGFLTKTNGDPLDDGQYTVTFNIYDDATAGGLQWGPFAFDGIARAKVNIAGGRFNVVLGPTADGGGMSLTSAFTSGAPRFLGITVGSNPEILPRQQILAAPTALHAEHATMADTAANFTSVVLKTDEVNARVGVGETSPNARLHVDGNATAPALRVEVTNATKLLVNTNGGTSIGSANAPPANGLRVEGRIDFEGTKARVSVTDTVSLSSGSSSEAPGWKPDGSKVGLLIETSAANESSGLFLNGDTAILYNPGDVGLFKIYDEDSLDNVDGAGTESPKPAFEVAGNGNVQFDRYGSIPTKIHSAVGSVQEEQLRMVRGNINLNNGAVPTVFNGKGFTVSAPDSSSTKVTFTTPFTDIPSCTATMVGTQIDNFISIGAITQDSVTFYSRDDDAQVFQKIGIISFIAVGAR